MDRIYYLERDGETYQTSDRLEALSIGARWIVQGSLETRVVVVEVDGCEFAEAA